MNNYTISDILGKGFKFEQKALPIETPAAFGTVFATVGVADWGPINQPYNITRGLTEFLEKFGDSKDLDLSKLSEYSRLSMEYHLKFSSNGFFTRVANANATKAFKEIILPATVAKILGNKNLKDGLNIRNKNTPKHHFTSTAPGGQNNLFKLDKVDTTVSIAELAFNPSPQAPSIYSREIGDGIGSNPNSISFSAGESLSLKIDGRLYTIILTNSDDLVLNSPFTDSDLTDLIANLKTKFETIFPNTSSNPFPTTISGFGSEPIFTISGNRIVLNSLEFGDESELQVIACTLGGVGNYLFTSTPNFRGTRTPLTGSNSIISQMNAHFDLIVGFSGIASASSNKILLTANPSNAGSNSKLKIGIPSNPNANIANELGFTSTDEVSGSDAINFGKFEAYYKGTRGNKIKIVSYGIYPENVIEVYFENQLLATFASYTHDPNDINDLSNLLKISSATKEVVTFTYTSGNLPPERLEWNLEFGNSGGATIDEGIVPNSEYIRELNKYSNIDLFDIDLITVSGKSSEEEIKNTLTEICETRQDCFTIIDTPFNTVLSSSNSIAVTLAKHYADNIGQLNSFYQVTYFPYILIENKAKKTNIVVPPSVRAVGTIAKADNYRKTKFGAPAGEMAAVITDIEGLTHFFESKEKDQLYADIFNSNINPISFNKSSGFFLDGNKTQQRKINGKRSPLDRINIMRVGLWIKKEIQKEVKYFFYEPNDPQSWEEFAKMLRMKMNILVDLRAIQDDFVIVCDSSLNTEEVVNNNGMIAKIDWRPINVLERIKLYTTIQNQKVTVSTSTS